jgi:glutathione S-transferase
MGVVLYHHPHTRAAGVVWMLEEVGVAYELKFVDLRDKAQKSPELLALNPMGKIPVLTDGSAVVTESAAIALYLADRYAPGRLSPKLDDPKRGTYLRWSLFAPSVIEPNALARLGGWTYGEGQAGWGSTEAMLAAIHGALVPGPFLLGDQFSMADVVFGGTLRYMLRFKMIDRQEAFAQYVARLEERAALQKADAINAKVVADQGLTPRL